MLGRATAGDDDRSAGDDRLAHGPGEVRRRAADRGVALEDAGRECRLRLDHLGHVEGRPAGRDRAVGRGPRIGRSGEGSGRIERRHEREDTGWRPSRPKRCHGAYRNQTRPTRNETGTGPNRCGIDRLAGTGRGGRLGAGVGHEPGLVVGELEVAAPERAPARPGRAATRLIARAPLSGSRNATIESRRGQRTVVGSRSSQSPARIVGSMLAWRMASRHGPRSRWRSDSVRRGPAARRGLGMCIERSLSRGGRRPASCRCRRSPSRPRRSRRSCRGASGRRPCRSRP